MENFKVAICSKGRGTFTTDKNGVKRYKAKLLGNIYENHINGSESLIDRYYLLIEKSDIEQYLETFPEWPKNQIIILNDENRGVSFARQTMLSYFQNELPTELLFVVDDDLSLFSYDLGINNKGEEAYLCNRRSDTLTLLNEFVEDAKQLDEWDKVGISSFDYNQFAWTNIPKFPGKGKLRDFKEVGKICNNFSHSDCVVLIKPMLFKELGIKYDANITIKEDRDINAQVAANGYYCRKMYRYCMDSPLNGTNSGGCCDFYKDTDRSFNDCQYVVDKWAKTNTFQNKPLCVIQKKKTCYNRTFDVKFYWKRFYFSKTRLPEGDFVIPSNGDFDNLEGYKTLDKYGNWN